MHESEWESEHSEPKDKKTQNFEAPWASARFLQAVLLELSGDRLLVLCNVPTPTSSGHSPDLGILGFVWSFQSLLQTCTMLYDHSQYSTVDKRSANECD